MSNQSHQHSVRIYYEDTDAGGIVYYANYLKFSERARTEWLRVLEINQSNFLEHSLGFVVRNIEMDNLASAKLDDMITVTTSIVELKKASITFNQIITNQEQQELCRIKVKVACVDFAKSKPCAIPATILGALKRVS